MRQGKILIHMLLAAAMPLCAASREAAGDQQTGLFEGQDLFLTAGTVLSSKAEPGRHTLVFPEGLSMAIGANRFSSREAVLWLDTAATEFRGRRYVYYRCRLYLRDDLAVTKGPSADTTLLQQTIFGDARSMLLEFSTSGEVLVTASKMQPADPEQLQLYRTAAAAAATVGPEFIVQPEAMVPEPSEVIPQPRRTLLAKVFGARRPEEPGAEPRLPEPALQYPINIAPAGRTIPKIEAAQLAEGIDVATVIGRFYLWQKQSRTGRLLELQADNAVLFYVSRQLRFESDEDVLATGAVRGIYMCGEVVMTEGQRTIRADEVYYDFERKKALAVNATMRNFDVKRGIPIYVRASKIRQLAENKFSAENLTLTSSEFHRPQVSMTASSVIITDTTAVDAEIGRLGEASYDAQMRDVRLKMGERTFFYWPSVRSNLQRPDVPYKSGHLSHDRSWGTSFETRWYLARLLGLRETEETDSTFLLDYYSKRGVGAGAEIDYSKDGYYGRSISYIIHDTGEDRLGRHSTRQNLEPPRELRGRFLWQHRHFLPYNWQLSTEVSYLSDENFLESYYRGEFNVDKEQETLVHLKRIEGNRGLSILAKARINDFADKLEELPSFEYHLTGQSLFDDILTFYSDSFLGRMRQRLGPSSGLSQDFFSFLSQRAELDLPMAVGDAKMVPFVAGTAAYEDGRSFVTDIGGGSGRAEDQVWLGEAGLRASTRYWKTMPDVRSRLFDVNGLRHIVKPYMLLSCFAESDEVIEQRDLVSLGLSQRWQTKRSSPAAASAQVDRTGPVADRLVDWMRLDTAVVWVDDSGDDWSGPDRLIWNKPFIPLLNTFSTVVPQLDRRGSDLFGPRRNSVWADYMWRLTDTTAVLSDMNFDVQSSQVQQYNVGFSRMCWPNLSYYIGSRYLKRVRVMNEEGSNAMTFAATYRVDPRYTLVLSNQYDFDYGDALRNDVTLVRRYHRVYWALTYSADQAMDDRAIVFSIWPEGVPEMALGSRRYTGLGVPAGY
jgi:hypothetical protein